jgi:hypothetical protein
MWQQKVFTKLLGLQYRIVYKKGSDNTAADALSQRVHDNGICCAISVATPQWSEDVIQGNRHDPQAQRLLVKLTIVAVDSEPFSLSKGVIRYKKRIWVSNNAVLQQQIIKAFHSSPLGGHSSIPATTKRLQEFFAWPGLQKHFDTFVRSCPTCQQAKVEHVKYPGLLQPLATPSSTWQVLSLDFIEGLPTSHGFDCILVVVDLFSKYSDFIALKHPFTALSVAKQFMIHIYKVHGCNTSGVKHALSIANHEHEHYLAFIITCDISVTLN